MKILKRRRREKLGEEKEKDRGRIIFSKDQREKEKNEI
jgi:hypothetical protein